MARLRMCRHLILSENSLLFSIALKMAIIKRLESFDNILAIVRGRGNLLPKSYIVCDIRDKYGDS